MATHPITNAAIADFADPFFAPIPRIILQPSTVPSKSGHASESDDQLAIFGPMTIGPWSFPTTTNSMYFPVVRRTSSKSLVSLDADESPATSRSHRPPTPPVPEIRTRAPQSIGNFAGGVFGHVRPTSAVVARQDPRMGTMQRPYPSRLINVLPRMYHLPKDTSQMACEIEYSKLLPGYFVNDAVSCNMERTVETLLAVANSAAPPGDPGHFYQGGVEGIFAPEKM